MIYLKTFETYDYNPIFKQLELFMSYKNRNMWLYDNEDDPIVSIYVRKAYHRVGKQTYDFLDLASISIVESRQGEGIFTDFLRRLLEKYPNQNIYVESILNPAVRHICNKFGFIDVDSDNMALVRTSLNEAFGTNDYYQEISNEESRDLWSDNDKHEAFTTDEMDRISEVISESNSRAYASFVNPHMIEGRFKNQIDRFISVNLSVDLAVIKLEDEWYVANVRGGEKFPTLGYYPYYKCDQFEGLIEFIKDIDVIALMLRQ
jgi:hypothetical protein